MAYALRYYKEIEHADGKVIRLEIHKKDSTAGAIEIGAVVQGLSLQIQGQQGDIDTPIVKTSLSMTFVDAQDIEDGRKNGFWQEFYTPDSVLWKIIVKAKDSQGAEFRTIWGGYVTPDSFMEDLIYRGSVNIIARDNIGHMQDFPFDAEGDADGMISLYNLVSSAWAKIDSPMALDWRGEGDSIWWMTAGDNTIAYDTLMNVSAFKNMNWYQALEKALYSYGVVMRYAGNNRVIVCSLRSMPDYGLDDSLRHIEPIFVSGATRELVPAVKRIEESVGYDLGEEYQPRIDAQDFSGNTFNVETSWGTVENIAWSLLQSTPISAFGWYNETPYKTLAFNPRAYEVDDMLSDSDKEDLHKYTCVLTGSKDDNTHSLSYAMSVNAEDFAINVTFGKFLSRLSHGYGDYFLGYPANEPPADYSVRFAVSVRSNGIKYYLTQNGVWSTEFASQKVVVSGDKMSVNVPLSGKYTGRVGVSFTFLNIDTSEEAVRIKQILALSFSSTINTPMLENNTINTNYQEGNNVILARDPELAPAYNATALPRFIKNGIFYRSGNVILPARKWSWGSGSEQQMAVYNHLQLLAYYAKPNNLISGTIVNGDVTRVACIYDWHGAEHLLVSGTFNLLNGHIESAVLREFTRYEEMWSDVAGADMPDTEQESRSNMEGSGASGGGASSTYTNTTDVNISGGGGGTGASYLNELLDVNTDGVVNQSVLYYNGTSWVDMSLSQLLSPYVKLQSSSQTIKGDITIEGNLIITGDVASGGEGGNTSAEGTVTGVTVSGVDYTSVEAGLLDLTDLMANYALKSASTKVSVSPSLSSGKSIGVISVDGVGTTLYAPATYAWSEIDGRPTNLSQFTDDVVSGKYLPLSGGKTDSLTIIGSGTAWLAFGNSAGDSFGSLGINSSHEPKFWNGSGATTLLHSGNVGEYAIKVDGSNKMAGRLCMNNNAIQWDMNDTFQLLTPYKANNYKLSYYDGSAWKTIAFTDSTVASAYKLVTSAGADAVTIGSNGLELHSGYVAYKDGDAYRYLGPQGSQKKLRFYNSTEWKDIAFTDSNVASATKLATARTIWGQSFDGTGDILAGYGVGLMSSKSYYGLSILPMGSPYWGVRTFLTYDLGGDTMGVYEIASRYIYGLTISHSGGVANDFRNIPSNLSYSVLVNIRANGNVGIGTTDPQYKLEVAGTGRFTNSLLVSGTLTANSGATITGDVTINGNLIVSGDVASGGTGQDTPSGTSTSGVLTLTGEIPGGSNIPQSSLDAIGLTDQTIADLLTGKYHHVLYTSGITTYCFVVSGQYNRDYKAFTLHWGDNYMDEFMGYTFSLGPSGGWDIRIYEI